MQRLWLIAVVVALFALPVAADVVNVYTVGSNPPGNALDPANNPIGGIPAITWTQNSSCTGCNTILSILAEGVDGGPNAPGGGEHDQVFFNGILIGLLTQQGFYSPLFNLQPGPGALPGVTGETLSFFDVSGLVVAGANTVTVLVDPGNWVNEVEVGTLTNTPEPGSIMLFGTGLFGLAGAVRRKLSR